MTSAVGHITQAASERSGDLSEIQQMNAHLQRQHERKDQELKLAKRETEDVQSQLENVQSSCTYFQNKYKTAAAEAKKLQQDCASASEKAEQFAQVAAQAKREVEQLRLQLGTLQSQNAQLAQRSGHAQQSSNAHADPYAQQSSNAQLAQRSGHAPQQPVPSSSFPSGTQGSGYFRGQALSQLAEVDIDGTSSRRYSNDSLPGKDTLNES